VTGRMKTIGLVAVIALLSWLVLGPQTSAQTVITGDSSYDSLIDQARADGATVIIIKPEAAEAGAAAAVAPREPSYAEQMIAVRTEFRRILQGAGVFVHQVDETLAAASPSGTMTWLLIAIVTAIGGIVVGLFVTRFLERWGREHFRSAYNPNPSGRSDKITYLMFRAFLMLLQTGVMFLVAMLVAVIFDTGHEPTRSTIFVIVSSFTIFRIARRVFFWNFKAPDAPSHRMVNLTDEEAQTLYRDWSILTVIVLFGLGLCAWMEALGLSADAHKLSLIVALLISAVATAVLAVKHRKPYANVILGVGDPEDKAFWRRTLARVWHLIAVAYLAVAWFVSFVRLTLDLPSAYGLVAAPMVILTAAFVIYGLALVAIDKFYDMRMRKAGAKKPAIQQPTEPLEAGEEMVLHKRDPERPYRPLFRELFEHAAAIVVSVVSIGELIRAWGIDLGQKGNPVTAALDTVVIIFMAYLAYRAANIYIDAQIEAEDGTAAVPGEEMSGQGASRLATLLPIFRNFLVITILVIAGMIVLSGIGIDIAPLFAGAGVIGLAIGFGAQTLIRDIFSGAFFLMDDAFRKGEYLDLGNVRGTVERISMRSFQLRHHNGPLHTIPFGDINQLTNFSRDWVMMKLPLRLTYDTDVERVRKLIKKLGQKLLEHPDVGGNFLEPLKSQGVFQMEDSAMIVRVKFMTKPGDQFTTRKVVYSAIRDLFEKEGIKFAHREVTVRMAEGGGRDLNPAERQAVAAAAREAIDDGAKPRAAAAADAP